jgi:hypothetical protein
VAVEILSIESVSAMLLNWLIMAEEPLNPFIVTTDYNESSR